MQPTAGMGPLGKTAFNGHVATLRYLHQQDGIEAHVSNRDRFGGNILAFCSHRPRVEISELLPDNFLWLVSEHGGDDEALIRIMRGRHHTSDSMETAKLILQHAQAPGLVGVDELLA